MAWRIIFGILIFITAGAGLVLAVRLFLKSLDEIFGRRTE
jgi:hypothetical protein